MNVIEIEGLNKTYDTFKLDNVSFKMKQGYIMGFIGENGAGKTTTLKAMLNVVKRNSGSVKIFGKNIDDFEIDIKNRIAFMSGETDFHSRKKLKTITSVFKKFYAEWDDDVYNNYMKRFKLDQNKKIIELSKGMRIKYAMALALSHNAELLILDEPTSGLDPVARDEMLEIFQNIVEQGDKSVLFSTHITTDLEKCADYITFIKDGKIIESRTKDDLIDSFRLVNGSTEDLKRIKRDLISAKENAFGFTGLIETSKLNKHDINHAAPSLDDIMIYHAIGGNHE